MDDPARDEEREQERLTRRSLLSIMFTMSMAGGYLMGVIATSLGLPISLHAPVLLGVCSAMFMYLRCADRRP